MEFLFNVKNLKNHNKVMVSFFSFKDFKSREKVMESLFSINNFRSHKKVTESFFSIKSFKIRKAVMEFFLSFKSFQSRKKVTESFFSGHASLFFHKMHKLPGTIFSLSVATAFFYYNNILISMKKDPEHISVNTLSLVVNWWLLGGYCSLLLVTWWLLVVAVRYSWLLLVTAR